jgi:glycosyltransferase involved in cell wall biosynthesis
MSEQVCAVVVTFNRKVLLGECLRGLLLQSRKLDHIVVVNNASTDGTREMLQAQFPQLEVITLPDNQGGAGGFHAGIKAAYERGYDWVWVMDDDVEPHEDCLETMLRYRSLSGFIHVRREHKGATFSWEGAWDVARKVKCYFERDISFENGREWISVNYGCFEGALIHRDVISKIGFPDVRFFMMGDDSIYGYLASLHTNVAYLNFVGIEKKLPPNGHPDRYKIYFDFRNRFLVYEYFRQLGLPSSRFTLWLGILLDAGRALKREKEIRTLTGVKSILTGLGDGVRQRFGRPGWIAGAR